MVKTKIAEDVKNLEAQYMYESTVSDRPVPVALKHKADDGGGVIVIVDEAFAHQRLRIAEKHFRDFGELPDKGQFPFTECDGDELVFTGQVFITSDDELEDV